MQSCRRYCFNATAMSSSASTMVSRMHATARLAQSAERKALNLVVVGSRPTVGALLLFFMADPIVGSAQSCFHVHVHSGPHRLVARTSRRGRDNPGSTPGAVILRVLLKALPTFSMSWVARRYTCYACAACHAAKQCGDLAGSHMYAPYARRKYSTTGTRTRVARVRAEYPNQLDYSRDSSLPAVPISCDRQPLVVHW